MKKPTWNSLRHLRRLQNPAVRSTAVLATLAVSVSVIASPPSHKGNVAGMAGSAAAIAGAHHWFQRGAASWYGRAFQGKRTATGERFDMNALTCAHRTLPLGSWLRVTNLRNRRSTFVRVNDRGPYEAGTIVDLSYAAAQRLGLLGKSQVTVEQVNPNDPALTHALLAQLSPLGDEALAQR